MRGLHDGSLSFGCSPRFDVSQFRFRRCAIRIGSDEDYVEFHFDGSVTAYCIARATSNVLGLERLGPIPACLEQKFVAIRVAALHAVAAEFALEGSGASGVLTTRVRLVGTRPHLGTPRPVMLVRRRNGSLVPVSNHPSPDVWAESNTPLDVLCGSVSPSMVESWKTTMDELSHCIGLPGSDLFRTAEIDPEEWDNDAQIVSAWIQNCGLAELPVPPRSG